MVNINLDCAELQIVVKQVLPPFIRDLFWCITSSTKAKRMPNHVEITKRTSISSV